MRFFWRSGLALLSIICGLLAQSQCLGDEGETPKAGDQEVVLGIDLGTTYSAAAIYTASKMTAEIVPLQEGDLTMPSVVYIDFRDKSAEEKAMEEKLMKETKKDFFFKNGLNVLKGAEKTLAPIVGWAAKKANKTSSPRSYFYRFKTLMGLNPSDPLDQKIIEKTRKHVQYDITTHEAVDGYKVVKMYIEDSDGKKVGWMTPKNASRLVLLDLKDQVQRSYPGIGGCVVTVPAYFNENQKSATKEAAKEAGLRIMEEGIINEPTSAALTYGYEVLRGKDMKGMSFLVFDFGGGTLDLSFLEYEKMVMEVIAHVGDNFLGGEHINDNLFRHFEKLLAGDGIKLTPNRAMKLRGFVEKIKIDLCNAQNDIDDQKRRRDAEEGKVDVDDRAYEDAKVSAKFFYEDDLDHSVVFELSTKLFEDICADTLKAVESVIDGGQGPDGDIAGILEKAKKKADNIERVLYVGGSSRIPAVRRMLRQKFKKAEHIFDLNPDTCVALGAAYHAAGLAGITSEKTFIALVDAVSMHVGIGLANDVFDIIVEANAKLPNSFSRTFTTSVNNQEKVRIEVGQSPEKTRRFLRTKKLGHFELKIPNPRPKGVPQIDVVIDLDVGGDIRVTATERESGLSENVKFNKDETVPTDEEIARMNEDRERHKEEDEKWELKINSIEDFVGEIARLRQEGRALENPEELEKILTKNEIWLENEKATEDHTTIRQKLAEVKEAAESILAASRAEKQKEEAYAPREDL